MLKRKSVLVVVGGVCQHFVPIGRGPKVAIEPLFNARGRSQQNAESVSSTTPRTSRHDPCMPTLATACANCDDVSSDEFTFQQSY